MSEVVKKKNWLLYLILGLIFLIVVAGCLFIFKIPFLMDLLGIEETGDIASSFFGLATIGGVYYVMLENNRFAQKRLKADHKNAKERQLVEYRDEITTKITSNLYELYSIFEDFRELNNALNNIGFKESLYYYTSEHSNYYLQMVEKKNKADLLIHPLNDTIYLLEKLYNPLPFTPKVKELTSSITTELVPDRRSNTENLKTIDYIKNIISIISTFSDLEELANIRTKDENTGKQAHPIFEEKFESSKKNIKETLTRLNKMENNNGIIYDPTAKRLSELDSLTKKHIENCAKILYRLYYQALDIKAENLLSGTVLSPSSSTTIKN